MEAFGAQAVGSATGVASLFLISKLMLWWYRRRVSGLVLLKGKSTICKSLSSERLLFVDIDEYLEKKEGYKEALEDKAKMMLLYTALRSDVDKMIRSYQKPVVFVSRHKQLLKILGIKKDKIHFVCASREAHKKSELLYNKPEEYAADEAERLRLLRDFKDEKVKVFEALADIADIVKKLFKVREDASF
jgi:hypothetical protein